MTLTNKPLSTAVLFIIYNRPHIASKVLKKIKMVKPKRLYIASDGPRTFYKGDKENVLKARELIKSIDWNCKVKTLFRNRNLGCKSAIEGAIDWFFSYENEGIILEDDCVPHKDFFSFCEKLLKKYRNHNDILTISGSNFQNGVKRGSYSYYFSNYFHCWGWATWKRTWNLYKKKPTFWLKWRHSSEWASKFSSQLEHEFWTKSLNNFFKNKIDSWDFIFLLCLWRNGGLNIIPNVNLVSNIGFGKDATHTSDIKDKNNSLLCKSIGKLKYPKIIKNCLDADKYTFDTMFRSGGKRLRLKYVIKNLIKKIFRFRLYLKKVN